MGRSSTGRAMPPTFLASSSRPNPPAVRAADMADVLHLRRAISAMARAKAAGERESDWAIPVINTTAAKPTLVPRFESGSGRRLLPGAASQALSTIARDAIDVFSSPLADRNRVCHARRVRLSHQGLLPGIR